MTRAPLRALAALRSEASFVLACLVGLVLRVVHLSDQLLVGDEWHALHKVAHEGFVGIFTSFGMADHSIPVSAYYELLSLTIGLSDFTVRLPFFVAGMAAIVALPLLVRRDCGKALADAWAWLLATSPLLVLYSRFARPYMISGFACVLALFAFAAWRRERRRGAAVLYVGAVLVAGASLPVFLPFALAAFPFHALQLVRARTANARDLRALIGLAVATGIPLLLVLGPALLADAGSLTSKVGRGAASFDFGSVLPMLAGVHSPGGLAAFVVLGAIGALRPQQPVPSWLPLALFAAVLQIAATLIVAPGDPFIFARYVFPVLPVLLLFPARGLLALAAALPVRLAGGARALLPALVAIVVIVVGPLRVLARTPDNWCATRLTLTTVLGEEDCGSLVRHVPDFYRELALRPPGSVVLIEAPLVVPITFDPRPCYQTVHRQWTKIGFLDGLLSVENRYGEMPHDSPRLESRNFVYLADLIRMPDPPEDYVVLHRDVRKEVVLRPSPLLGGFRKDLALDLTPVVAALRMRFGEPVREDEDIIVFALRGAPGR